MVTYKLVFSGGLVAGKTVEEVKQAAITSLKLSQQAVEKLFDPSRQSVVIKTLDDLPAAERFVERFQRVGMILDIKPSGLSMEPLSVASTSAVAAESTDTGAQGTADNDDEPGWIQHLLVNMRFLFSFPLLLIVLGLVLGALYLPYPDGYLKNGFLAGCVILLFGFKRLRARF